jgi:hypothetical protein
MKKIICFAIGIFMQFTFVSNAQSQFSNYGNIMPVHASPSQPFKILFVFADYPLSSACAGSDVPWLWDANGLPLNVNDYVDPVLPATGPTSFFSKYFYEASFGQFVVLGDYVSSPVHLSCGQSDNEVITELNTRYNNGTLNFGHYFFNGSQLFKPV